jgi:RNA polymerase sigma-70 factor (ECF subfamily)
MIRLINELPVDQRSVLLLRLVADLPTAEVAQILGKSQGAVKALHRRGLTALRKRIAVSAVPRSESTAFTSVP